MMRLTKMHGARNDFVVIDRRAVSFDGVYPERSRKAADDTLGPFAVWACDRRAGIGADGLIVIESSRAADARMRTFNADGSEAEMCGNGIRCAARWLDEAGEGESVTFETDAGLVRTKIVARAPEYLVRVAMGRPTIAPIAVAAASDASFVDTGNPHVVLFARDGNGIDLEAVAVEMQSDAQLSKGANVHVVTPSGRQSLRVTHWERGAGLTMACGTGAVACAAAAIERGVASSPVEVFVPGGRLIVEWEGGDAYLVGPAVRVFDTEVDVGVGTPQ
jgi:diaminopimelate epimerase